MFSGISSLKAETVEVTTSFGNFEVDTQAKTATLVKGLATAVVDSVLTVPDEVEYNGTSYPVIKIGENAIKGLALVKTLNSGANIEVISEMGIYNLAACTQVNLNSKLRVIGESGIGRLRKLTQITLPASLDSIGYTPFYNNTTLSDIKVDAGNKTFSAKDGMLLSKDGTVLYVVPEGMTSDELTLPARVRILAPYSVSCTDIKSVILPEGVEEIGDYAFSDSSIESVSFPSTLKTIGNATFAYTSGFKTMTVATANPYLMVEDNFLLSKDRKQCYISVRRTGDCSIPQGVETIHKSICFGMDITSLSLPASVRTVGISSFASCKNLTSLKLNEGLDSIGTSAFAVSGMTEVTLPGTVKRMGEFVFNGCPSLEKAVLKEGLTEIGPYAFVNCAKLTDVSFPTTLIRIGYTAFQATAIKILKLPENLEYIEHNAFERAQTEGEIVIPKGVKVIEKMAFNYMPNVTSIVCTDVEVLEDIALGNCHELKTIILGNKLRKCILDVSPILT